MSLSVCVLASGSTGNATLVSDGQTHLLVDCGLVAREIETRMLRAGFDPRGLAGVLITHAHNDHITVAPELSERLDAPVLLNPADDVLWEMTHPGVSHGTLVDGERIRVAGTDLVAIATPGHSPGSTCLYMPEAGELFTGDTLFSGGPGATGRSFSDFPTIIGSIRDRLFTLPAETKVHTGHGDGTTIGTEAPHLEEWIRRGN